MNYLGTRLRALRESQGMLLRQVAAQIEVDTALISKIERGERRAQREHVTKMATALNAQENELTALWLADKLNDVIQNEPMAERALQLIQHNKN